MIIYFKTTNPKVYSNPSPGKSSWNSIQICEKSELVTLRDCGATKIHRLNAQIYALDPPFCPSVSTRELLERLVIKSELTNSHRYV